MCKRDGGRKRWRKSRKTRKRRWKLMKVVK